MSRGGSRYGAGRPGHKAKAEHLRRIDIRTWRKGGYLARAGAFGWYWHRDGERTGAINVHIHGTDALTLCYAVNVDGQQADATQLIGLTHTPCPYGNTRPWFQCPHCNRRCAVLFYRWRRFACRHCQRVSYASQSEDALDRLWRKQGKIEARLGENRTRPKGMRRHTHAELREAWFELEVRREEWLGALLERLMSLP